MSKLFHYARSLVTKAQKTFVSGEFFAKILMRNDDSGRHGVLIPSDAYSFFPDLPIPDPASNATQEFAAFNAISSRRVTVAYKYYERYPERRITRLDPLLNDISSHSRLIVVLRAKDKEGNTDYYFDCLNSTEETRFNELFTLLFGSEVACVPGCFVVRPVDSGSFLVDAPLGELLKKFDEVKGYGWIDSMRAGDTGIGYTFETLLGIKENNDQKADFKGIEIKCKALSLQGNSSSTKINLFQAGPNWITKASTRDRIRTIGKPGKGGLYICYSQVTANPNNLGLLLAILESENKIDLRKNEDPLAYWPFQQLETRLAEKHSRTAFVKARKRNTKTKTQFLYEELVYCDRPSIQRFIDLVARRNIVFEFTMSEKPDGTIRNHGYPWRLLSAEFLDQLFSFQIKLR